MAFGIRTDHNEVQTKRIERLNKKATINQQTITKHLQTSFKTFEHQQKTNNPENQQTQSNINKKQPKSTKKTIQNLQTSVKHHQKVNKHL